MNEGAPGWAWNVENDRRATRLSRQSLVHGGEASWLSKGSADLHLYRRDAVASLRAVGRRPPEGGKRGKIVELSEKARARMVFAIRNSDVDYRCMITLTYPWSERPLSGKQFHSALRVFLQRLSRSGRSWAWFSEFTKRGAVHAHVLISHGWGWDREKRRGRNVNRSREWELCRVWAECARAAALSHGVGYRMGEMEKMSRASCTLEEIERADGAARYAAKYGAKMEQKTVPEDYQDIGRWWGMSLSDRPKKVASIVLTNEEEKFLAWGLVEHDGVRRAWPYKVQFGLGVEEARQTLEGGEDRPSGLRLPTSLLSRYPATLPASV